VCEDKEENMDRPEDIDQAEGVLLAPTTDDLNQSEDVLIDPITEAELLESFRALPTEDELPCDDGEPMETARHRDQMTLLIESLKSYWSERTDYYVGGNMFVHYDPTNARRSRGPDFFLVMDVENRERKSWVVWHEGMRFPDVIIELLSDSTRKVDKGEKKALYARLFRTAEYYLFDPYSQEFTGYRLHGVDYQEVEPDAEGRIHSAMTDLSLGVKEDWLRWFTAEGDLLPTPQESAAYALQQAEQATRQAEQERKRAEQAEQLLKEYQRRFGHLE
jgi:Uma2 family endonuclease